MKSTNSGKSAIRLVAMAALCSLPVIASAAPLTNNAVAPIESTQVFLDQFPLVPVTVDLASSASPVAAGASSSLYSSALAVIVGQGPGLVGPIVNSMSLVSSRASAQLVAAPEPGSLALLGLGLVAIGISRLRRKS